ncbi:MAG: hypothetical protein J7L08_03115, partial [Candidatus Aenigmarchaeota archaeon]|nr:hypothetical protein [Candidatus Aenigmarchaeota archaeon]
MADDEKYKCRYCGKHFGNPGALGMHIRASHPEHRRDINDVVKLNTVLEEKIIKNAVSKFNRNMKNSSKSSSNQPKKLYREFGDKKGWITKEQYNKKYKIPSPTPGNPIVYDDKKGWITKEQYNKRHGPKKRWSHISSGLNRIRSGAGNIRSTIGTKWSNYKQGREEKKSQREQEKIQKELNRAKDESDRNWTPEKVENVAEEEKNHKKPTILGEEGPKDEGRFGMMVGGRVPVGEKHVGGPIEENPKEELEVLEPLNQPDGNQSSSQIGENSGGDKDDQGDNNVCEKCGRRSKKLIPYKTPTGIKMLCPKCLQKLIEQAQAGREVKIPCPKCGATPVYTIQTKFGIKLKCPACGYVFTTKRGGRLRTTIFRGSLVSFIISALIAFGIMMVFGTSQGTIMVAAGIVMIAMESFFGSTGNGGYVKAIFRTMGFMFVGFGLFFILGSVPLLKVVPLLIVAFELVTYPMPEEVTSEVEKGLQVMRMILGFSLVFMFYLTFHDLMSINLYLFWSLLLLSAAFFIAVPVCKSAGDKAIDNAFNKLFEAGQAMGEGMAKALGKRAAAGLASFAIKLMIFVAIVGMITKYLIPFFGIPVDFLGSIGSINSVVDLVSGSIIGLLIFLFGAIHTARDPRDVNGTLLGLAGGGGVILGSIALQDTLFAQFFFLLIVTVGIMAA